MKRKAAAVIVCHVSSSARRGGSFCCRLRAVSRPEESGIELVPWHSPGSGSGGVRVSSCREFAGCFGLGCACEGGFVPSSRGCPRSLAAVCDSTEANPLFCPSRESWRLLCQTSVTPVPARFSPSLPLAPSPGFPCPAHPQHRRATETHG